MLDRILTYLQFGNTFCGVEHTIKDDKELLYVTRLKKTKKEVFLEDSFSSNLIEEVFRKLPRKQPIFLIINNEQVLTKSLKKDTTEAFKLVNKAFPNINISDFYYEIVKQGAKYFVSICRKSYVDNIIKEYNGLGGLVINFSLGNSIISNVISYMDSSIVFTSNALLILNNNIIETIENKDDIKEKRYNVNGLNITSFYILSLSGALSSILSNYSPLINFKDKINLLLNSFKQVRFYNQFLKIGLSFILGLLLINFLFFNFYFTELETLKATFQLNQTTKSKIITLNEDVIKAQKLSDDLFKSSVSKSSFFINSIVNSLPNSILLTEINYQPLQRQVKAEKPIELKNNMILISGESSHSNQYSEWISNLEGYDWISSVQVENYSDSKTTTSTFRILIQLSL